MTLWGAPGGHGLRFPGCGVGDGPGGFTVWRDRAENTAGIEMDRARVAAGEGGANTAGPGGGHAPRWGAPMAADPSAVKAFPAAGEWRTPLPHKQEGDHRPNPRGGVRRRGGGGRVPSDHDLS